ncbi:hypothetical protein [Niabella beijingensis]|uniref:hypothetical protein n=1 Tax=Niabella beijingensis TaxID=2872700 RepID=UPI001CBCB7E2|nr:hypothetical protein [Niabella beijingensis]MBZ4187658.1 hypothetical protein [Niabella beijingensis]
MQSQQKAKLMRLSWQIQRQRKSNRSKSLVSAWAIYLNEDITVYHLVRKHSPERYTAKIDTRSLTLF